MESTVPVSLLIDCRGSTGGTQGVWEDDLCGCGGVTMVGGAMVSVWSFLTNLQIVFTKPSHACFRLSMVSFDVVVSGVCCGMLGWAWGW